MSEPSTYQPPYTTTPAILNRVPSISGAIGRQTVLIDQARSLRRHINRIRAIQRQWLAQHGDG